MLKRAKPWLRSHPRLYDLSVQARRMVGIRTNAYNLLNEFSLLHNRKVKFVQIGASDGLHSDPIREFIVRDGWSGVCVEPLLYSFARLKKNYHYLHKPALAFVNAAVVASEQGSMSFWTFSEDYLTGLSEEERLDHLQKSSFKSSHVAGFVASNPNAAQAVVEIAVSCLTLSNLADQYLQSPDIDLLVTDCEGYEAALIPSIDFHRINPQAIFYESHNLGDNEIAVGEFLVNSGYHVFQLGGDTFAVKAKVLKTWQGQNACILQTLTYPLFGMVQLRTEIG